MLGEINDVIDNASWVMVGYYDFGKISFVYKSLVLQPVRIGNLKSNVRTGKMIRIYLEKTANQRTAAKESFRTPSTVDNSCRFQPRMKS